MSGLSIPTARSLLAGYLADRHYGAGTVRAIGCYLAVFFRYLYTQCGASVDLREVRPEQLRQFLSWLPAQSSPRTGRPYARRTLEAVYSALRHLFRCLLAEERILADPLAGLTFRPPAGGLLRVTMSEAEMAAFLDGIDAGTPAGMRDRALFELLYATGLRAAEVVKLRRSDVDLASRLLWVRQGKWGKDRLVPLSETAVTWLTRYEGAQDRPPEAPLFAGPCGHLAVSFVNRRFQRLLRQRNLYREGLCAHSIRHAVASHLLAAGADLRYVQELLGHESMETTVGYTRQLEERVKRFYKSYHPKENLFYQDLEEDYRRKLERLAAEVERAKRKSRPRRAYQKRHAAGKRAAAGYDL